MIMPNHAEASVGSEPSPSWEESLSEMVNSCPVAMYLKDGYGRWTTINDELPTLLGNECAEWIGLTSEGVCTRHPGRALLLQRLEAVENAAWQAAARTHLETWLIDHTGEARFVDIWCKPSFHPDGSRRMIAVSLVESTQRKRSHDLAEHALGLFSGGPVAVIVWRPEPGWPVSYVSSNIREVLGYTEAHLLSSDFRYASLIHPDDLEHVWREAEACFAKRERSFEQFYRVRCASGLYRWFYDFTQPIYSDSGRLVEIRGYILDQTQLEEIQQQLRSHLSQLSLISSHVPGMLYTFKPGPVAAFPYVSHRIHDVCGLAPEEVRGDASPFIRLIHPEDLDGFLCSVRDSVQRVADWKRDFRFLHPLKGERWLHASSSPRRTDNGSVVWDGYCFDSTDRVLAEKRLMQDAKREAIERLSGGIAHAFNNHLASLSLGVELLHDMPGGDARIQEITESLKCELQAARAVARQLLAFTKDQPMELERVKLAPFLNETIAFALRGSQLTFETLVSPPDAAIGTDPHLVRETLINLAMNSRQAIAGNGSVSVRAVVGADGGCRLDFEDSGPGIPLELAQTIFEPYFTTKKDSSGLGLYVSRSLARRLGGDLILEDHTAGRTCFRLMLPHLDVGLSKGDSEQDATNKVAGRRVLLLEDETLLARLLRRFFDAEGLALEWFTDGADLLERSTQYRDLGPDLVCLLDISVRGAKGGLDILENLRKNVPHARILLTSGYSQDWCRREEMLLSLNTRFLAKPYGLDQLREAVFAADPVAQSSVEVISSV